MRRRLSALPLALILVGLGACASGSSGSSTTRSNPDLITEAELASVETLTAYEAVQRLRPRWLQSRRAGEEPVVFMDGAQVGGLQFLRNIQASQLSEIRHRSGRDATTRYGTGYGGGTIEVRTKN